MKTSIICAVLLYSVIGLANTTPINSLKNELAQTAPDHLQWFLLMDQLTQAYIDVSIDSAFACSQQIINHIKNQKNLAFTKQAVKTRLDLLKKIRQKKQVLDKSTIEQLEHSTQVLEQPILLAYTYLYIADYKYFVAEPNPELGLKLLDKISVLLVEHEDLEELINKEYPNFFLYYHQARANFYRYKNNNTLTLRHYLKAYNYAVNYNLELPPSLYYQLGITYIDFKDYKKGLEFINLLIDKYKTSKSKNIAWYAYMPYAACYLEEQKYDSVYWVVEQAEALHRTDNLSAARGYFFYLKATALLEENRLEEALIAANKGLAISIQQNEPKEKNDCYVILSKIYLKKENYSKALHYIQLADKQVNINPLFKRTEAEVYKNLGNWKKAYLTLEDFYAQRDSNYNENEIIQANAEFISLQFEQERKEQQLKTEKAAAISKANLAVQTGIRNVFITASCLLGILSFVFYRFYKQTQRTQQLILHQKEALTESSTRLKELNLMKDRIFYIIGHDLRAPISSWDMLLDELLRGTISLEQFAEFIPQLKRNTSNMALTLNNMLHWGLLQGNQLEGIPQQLSLHQEVEHIKDFLSELLRQKQLELENDVAENLFVYVDPNQLNLILRNLINNSIKFTPSAGKIRISAISNDTTLEVQVEDSGIGIADDMKQEIFKHSISAPSTLREKGTGIGLMLCKEFIEKLGGRIWVESTLGQGSKFQFTLPKSL